MAFDRLSHCRWIKPTMKYVCVIVLLCVFTPSNTLDFTATGSSVYKVQLKSPSNITILYKNENDIIIMWSPPQVYDVHQLNFSYLNQTDILGELKYTVLNSSTSATPAISNLATTTPSASGKVEKGDNLSIGGGSNLPGPKKPKCMPHDDFLDIDKFELLVDSIDSTVKMSISSRTTGDQNESNTSVITVDFDKGCVEQYLVNYAKAGSDDFETITVSAEITECNITGLTKGTTYTIFVSAVFESGDVLNSTSISASTSLSSNITDCHCSYFGRVEGTQCEPTASPWCKCKPQYHGAFCELCKPGFYRSAPYFPCNKCPCSPLSTNSPTCHYREGYLVCSACKRHYTGHLCQSCSDGYYRYHGRCVQCYCNGNNLHNATRLCDPYTGACTKCAHNTSGFHCEKCRDGYERETAKSRRCVLKHELAANQGTGPSNGLIAGICIAVILALCAVVGFVVYRRWKVFPPKPFWTVELKEDHDSVNFSALPGQDYVKHDAAEVQDLEFYEKRGRNTANYLKLREEI